jgi:phospholipid-binding lipoprotein MlaA
MNTLKRGVAVLALAAAMSGCATNGNPQDPFEGFNRAMFTFNDALDQAVLKPVATVYREATPSFVQTGIGNFFGNIGDIWTAVNNLLQGKLANGVSDIMRVTLNTTFGLGGLIDIGSDAGLQKHKEDFGETLAVWGFGSGPYVVLPFLGSSTLRDTVALPVDFAGDLWTYHKPVRERNIGSVVRVIDGRAAILNASNLIEDAALDRYEFIRDAYLQRRANKIQDGYNSTEREDRKSSALPSAPESAAKAAQEPATGSGVQMSGASGAPQERQGVTKGGAEKAEPLSRIPAELLSFPSSEVPV